jgi:hypothetical protein
MDFKNLDYLVWRGKNDLFCCYEKVGTVHRHKAWPKTQECEESFDHVQIDRFIHSYNCLCKEYVIFHQNMYMTDSIKALSFLKDRKKIGNIKDITNFPLWLNRSTSRSSYNPKHRCMERF